MQDTKALQLTNAKFLDLKQHTSLDIKTSEKKIRFQRSLHQPKTSKIYR